MISPLNQGASPSGGAAPSGNQAVALRVAVIGAVLLGLFAIVFFRLWYLQVLSGDSLAAAASQNRTRSVPVTAPRGYIIDRKGRTIVSNRRAQIVELAPGSLPTIERSAALEYGQKLAVWHASITTAYGAARVAKWRKIPVFATQAHPRPRIVPLTDATLVDKYLQADEVSQLTELKGRYKRLGKLLGLPADEVRRRVITSLYLLPYANIPLSKKSASEAVVEYIGENADMFVGVSTTRKYVRSYPFHGAGAQLFGQVGSVPIYDSGKDKGLSRILKYRKLNTASQVGLNGLELEYDSYLRGQDGLVKATIDARGNVIGTPKEVDPVAGDRLQLTIDRDLQVKAEDLLKAGSKWNPGGHPGAIVAMDPTNGEVLASQSNPTFDPNVFVRGVSDEQFQQFIDENGDKPLFNRVTDAGYAAGSTFKPVTAFAELASGVATSSTIIPDAGKIKISDQTFQNANATPNGDVNLEKAIQVSSDVYFYKMGALMNDASEPLQLWARKLGYGRKTGIDLPGENPGIIPDRAWRKQKRLDEIECRDEKHISQDADVYTAGRAGCGISDKREWTIGDNVQLAIGQGDVSVTPLQSAVMYSAIENGGTIVRPHLARAIEDRTGATRQTFQFKSRAPVDLEGTGALETIRKGLYEAANVSPGTSAAVFANWPRDKYPIFGKTGTAQRQGHGDQSWYAAYVPGDRPIVVVATVEDGGYGADTAAPIVGEMLKQWYGLKGVEIVKGDSETK